jgi:hypothetical protein
MPMIYEMRRYQVLPGRMPAMLKRFETRTLKIWERLGIRQVGFWTNVVGPSSLELFYILAWADMAEREAKWDAFVADPEWHEAVATSEKDGPIVRNVENSFMRTTAFSAMR